MKTKALLLTALLGAAGAASSVAQTNSPYSQNAVGYINLSLGPGFSMVANPLINVTNDLNTIVTNVPAGTILYFLDSSSSKYNSTTFTNGSWTPLDNVLSPGNGALMFQPIQQAINLTFVGSIPQGSLSTHIPAGLSIQSIQIPVALSLTNNLVNFPVSEGDTVYRFNNASGQFSVATYTHGRLQPSDVIPAVGESFFVLKSAAADWNITFTINDVKARRWTNSTWMARSAAGTAGAFAQGTVNFCNVAGSLSQPLFDKGGNPLDTNGTGNFLAELLSGPDASHLTPIPSSVTRIVNGQFFGGSVALPAPPTNGAVSLQVVAWDGSAAADFATASQNGAAIGRSAAFNAVVSTAAFPVPPATMTNLTSFVVKPPVNVGVTNEVLTITLSGTNAVIGWTAATNVTLQKAFALNATNWLDVAGTQGTNRFTTSGVSSNAFFRTIAR